ncbi:Fic family protein [Desulfovibrio sp. JY]|nr:Fic family protein [Desulfovibrio sp. JY]
MSDTTYTPPFAITPIILDHVAAISHWLGAQSVLDARKVSPRLRRDNQIRTIQATLAIEGNSLSVPQVTAVLEGKRVLGSPREVQEVHNALTAYDMLAGFDPTKREDFLRAHGLLMYGLIEDAGAFRRGAVAVARGENVVHMPPPAMRVAGLVDDLLGWLGRTNVHPLVAGCVTHYEIEFIHPFSDGNGRLGRFWQTVILAHWNPVFAAVPVESVVRDRQDGYYAALGAADHAGAATPFVEFMLQALRDAALAAVPA